ncbi:hypothetical protein JTE90_004160 [Oedothorax gibbosus]|uniref:DDE-1 domain-containing protein n=1 Tax=Oedothorax gibbosus TaxID=931172 RepID=A0AAV6TV00_9ARAC|nr:hypothetical protein JTE90_004160 [Oedothorax gibbosus]
MRKLINHDGPIQEFQAAYNVKDAITDVSAAWKDVKKETVRRGWRKLFLAASFESSSSDEDFEGFVIKKSPLEDIIKYAQQYNVKSSSGATENILQDWVCVDDCAPTSEVITEEDLLETHLNTKSPAETSETESSEEEEGPRVSWEEAERSIDTFLNFCSSHKSYSTQEILQLRLIREKFLNKKKNSLKQIDIRSFFKKVVK